MRPSQVGQKFHRHRLCCPFRRGDATDRNASRPALKWHSAAGVRHRRTLPDVSGCRGGSTGEKPRLTPCGLPMYRQRKTRHQPSASPPRRSSCTLTVYRKNSPGKVSALAWVISPRCGGRLDRGSRARYTVVRRSLNFVRASRLAFFLIFTRGDRQSDTRFLSFTVSRRGEVTRRPPTVLPTASRNRARSSHSRMT
jgi:hypothetical protein